MLKSQPVMVRILIFSRRVDSDHINTDEDYDPDFVSASEWEILSDDETSEDKSWSEIDSVISK